MSIDTAPTWLDPEVDAVVLAVTGTVSQRLIDHVEGEAGGDQAQRGHVGDDRHRQLMVGAWISEELRGINEERLAQGLGPLDELAERLVRSRVVADITGAGPLEPYLNDPTVEEIDVNSAETTWITYADGRKVNVGRLWVTAADLTSYQKRLALRMASTGEGRLDTSSPMLTMQSIDGSRIVMVLGGEGQHGISSQPRIAIRRFVVRQVGLDGLVEMGLLPHRLADQLSSIVRCGFTILVSGPPGAGKTTLLTELLGEISPLERIVTVEKNLLELRLEDDPRHPDAPALYTRHANAEGVGEITTRQLVELTRRLNPDRVVVGELVEDEALDMLDVASMCKRGSLATIHAHTADVVLQRLAYYVSKSNTNLPEFAVWSLIAQTVDFVVHIDLDRNITEGSGARRRVTSLIEVGGLGEAGGVASTEIWGMDDDGEFRQLAPVSARHLRRLRLDGHSPELFAIDDARIS